MSMILAKLPDAMYGLGLAYQGLGNIPQARQLLNDIVRRFPNTGVANLADTRLHLDKPSVINSMTGCSPDG